MQKSTSSDFSSVAPSRPISLLLVSDNDLISVLSNLKINNIATTVVRTDQALQAVSNSAPDVVLMDFKFVGENEFSLISNMRRISNVPIVVISEDYEEEKICRALQSGADEYIGKPVGIKELMARIEAVSRRTRLVRLPETAIEKIDDYLSIDHNKQSVIVGGETKKLSPTEYRLLSMLLKHRGRVLTHQELLIGAWGEGYESAQVNLRLYIYYLRKKIEPDPSSPRYIQTGYWGYCFAG